MKTHWQTRFVAILLAIFLFGSNAIGLHALTHNDDLAHHTDCEYCTFLVQKELQDTIVFEANTFQSNNITKNFALVPNDYSFVITNEVSLSTYFTRPPPFFI